METNKESFETNKPRSWRSWLKGIGWCLLALAIFAIAFIAWKRNEYADKLQKALAEMDRTEPGWRLEDIEAARRQIPEEENSARMVVAAVKLLPPHWPSANLTEERFRLLLPHEKLSREDFIYLSRELARARAALDVARKLADMPRGRHHLHYERDPIATRFPDQMKSRGLMTILSYEAMRLNQKGETKNALMACRSALNAARSLGDEPIALSQMIRNSGALLVCQAIERTLAQGEPPPQDMAALQKLLEDEDAVFLLPFVMRGERAMLHQIFEQLEHGEMSPTAGKWTEIQWNRLKNFFISLRRMDVRQEHALTLSLMTRRIRELQQPLHEQAALEGRFEREVDDLPKSAFLTRLLMPAMSKMGKTFRPRHAYLRCAIVALAAERYRQEKKACPDSVKPLCPEYLADVPLDPFDGKPLRYRCDKDGVIIYSIGPDVIDNSGNLSRERPSKPDTDIGFRLWDVTKRRQPPRAKPPQAMKAR